MFRIERHGRVIRNNGRWHRDRYSADALTRLVAGVSQVGAPPLLAPGRPITAASPTEPAISVRHLWKVFGPKAAQVAANPELCALSRRELMERHGCTAAVRDAQRPLTCDRVRRVKCVFDCSGLSDGNRATSICS